MTRQKGTKLFRCPNCEAFLTNVTDHATKTFCALYAEQEQGGKRRWRIANSFIDYIYADKECALCRTWMVQLEIDWHMPRCKFGTEKQWRGCLKRFYYSKLVGRGATIYTDQQLFAGARTPMPPEKRKLIYIYVLSTPKLKNRTLGWRSVRELLDGLFYAGQGDDSEDSTGRKRWLDVNHHIHDHISRQKYLLKAKHSGKKLFVLRLHVYDPISQKPFVRHFDKKYANFVEGSLIYSIGRNNSWNVQEKRTNSFPANWEDELVQHDNDPDAFGMRILLHMVQFFVDNPQLAEEFDWKDLKVNAEAKIYGDLLTQLDEKDQLLTKKDLQLAEKDRLLAEKDYLLEKKDETIVALRDELESASDATTPN